jgi:hypothetical protein
MSALASLIRRAALNPAQLASRAIKDPRLLPAIVDGLQAEQARVKYGCAKALRLIAEQHPALLYPHWDFFVRLLDHENNILQWHALYLLSQLVRVDSRNRFSGLFARYFSSISGPVMITAATAIQGGARIAQAKPRLADRIAAEVLKVERARYQTAECRNIAIGHAIVALGEMLPLLEQAAPVLQFVRRHTRNSRAATRKKAECLLKLLVAPANAGIAGRTAPRRRTGYRQ